jgi:hypothetical protein
LIGTIGTEGSFSGAETAGAREADVKKEWSYTSTPPYVFMAWWKIKHREIVTFYFRGLETTSRTLSTIFSCFSSVS